MATAAQVNSFINTIAPIAQRQAEKHGNKVFASVCIAQACCESAFGTSPKMVRANAIFGIKVGNSKYHFGTAWKDKAYSTKTKECYDGKTYTQITDMFRAYDSYEESVEDYFDMLCNAKRYKYALNQPTPLACIQGIQKAPYATSPTYVQTIMNIVNKYGLTKYDGAEVFPTIKRGCAGDYVVKIQNAIGFTGKDVDGIFGSKTETAVKIFQTDKGLKPDGIVGPLTWAAING